MAKTALGFDELLALLVPKAAERAAHAAPQPAQ
jgi:hypothetical protein